MPATVIRGRQIRDNTIVRADYNVATPGDALVRRVLDGAFIGSTATGADSGTDDVTVRVDPFMSYPDYPFDCDSVSTLATSAGWQTALISTGTLAVVTTSIAPGTPTATQGVDLANHPGVLSLSCSGVSGTGAQIFWGPTGTGMLFGGGEQFDAIVFVVSNTNTVLRVGFHDSVNSTDAVDGVYFDMDNTGAIRGRAKSNNVTTSTAILLTASANTWYHLRWVVNATASQATFTIYDMAGNVLASASVTGNIPTTPGRECLPRVMSITFSALARLLVQVDYVNWSKPYTRGALN